MLYGNLDHFQTGVAIPVSGLRSRLSCGIGEYADLALLGRWAQKAHLDLVQILPINDTGHMSSPYSALSAFALHPIYLRMQEIPGAEEFLDQIRAFAAMHQGPTIDYEAVLHFKLDLLGQIWAKQSKQRRVIQEVEAWEAANPWIQTYGLYSHFKTLQGHKAWWQWSDAYAKASPIKLEAWATKYKSAVRFYAWVQMHAENQLREAVLEMQNMGVRLKGDIPILINEDSADSWGHPELFDMKNRAGAPPDMFCYTGQNWGFPCYQWDALAQTDYAWWKDRLRHAAKFYHAFRIDHVLGFFRIWQIPSQHRTGMLGRFVPSLSLHTKELLGIGLSQDWLQILSVPHFKAADLDAAWVGLPGKWSSYFVLHGDWYVFSPELKDENALEQLDVPGEIKGRLFELFWNRMLLQFEGEPDAWYPYWYCGEARIAQHLDAGLRSKLFELLGQLASRQEAAWEQNGENLLRMMSSTTDMLVCAEDLGVVPDCVGPTLERLNILSLKIERWARDYHSVGQPFVHPSQYPRFSVNSPSCHDTSTLRGWWEEEGTRDQFAAQLGLNSQQVPTYLTTEVARKILERNLAANSLICLFPLQDWMSLHYDLRTEHPEQERINVPGSLAASNWAWRMQIHLEDLINYHAFYQQVAELVDQRRSRSL
jgi:4-alpha-glucanotransferase